MELFIYIAIWIAVACVIGSIGLQGAKNAIDEVSQQHPVDIVWGALRASFWLLVAAGIIINILKG